MQELNDNQIGSVKMLSLKVFQILYYEANEHNPMKTELLIKRLNESGFITVRQTLYKTIQLMNQYGFEVSSSHVGKSNAYFLKKKYFSMNDLVLLMKAIQDANFLLETKKTDLINKISSYATFDPNELIEQSKLNNSYNQIIDNIKISKEKKKLLKIEFVEKIKGNNKEYHNRFSGDIVVLGLINILNSEILIFHNLQQKKTDSCDIRQIHLAQSTNDDIPNNELYFKEEYKKFTQELIQQEI